MRTLIEGYENHPGQHCGSTAMRGLLQHYSGLKLPEPAVFGLGSGVASPFLSVPSLDPSPVLFGRSATLEVDAASALGIDYRELTVFVIGIGNDQRVDYSRRFVPHP